MTSRQKFYDIYFEKRQNICCYEYQGISNSKYYTYWSFYIYIYIYNSKIILLENDESYIANEKIGSTTRKSHMCLLFGNVTGNAQDSLALKI